jgi:hypothetical protein
MKNFMRLSAAFAAIALLAAGCANEETMVEPIDPMQGGDGTITISVAPSNPGGATRALLGEGSDAVIAAFESNVEEFTVYLFDGETGEFLEQKTSDTDQKQIVFAGYEDGQKLQAIAIANHKTANLTIPVLTKGTSTIADVTAPNFKMVVDLTTQVMDDTSYGEILGLLDPANIVDITANLSSGLLMTGQYGADENTGDIAPATAATDKIFTVGATVDGNDGYLITIPVERVVARVELGQISYDENLSFSDIVNFQLNGAGVQKAISHSFIYPTEITTYPIATDVIPSTDFKYFGTWAGTGSPASEVLGSYTASGTEGSGLLDIRATVSGILTTALNNSLASTLLTPIQFATGLNLAGIVTGILDGTLDGADKLLTGLDGLGLLPVNLGDLLDNPNNFWYVLPNSATTNPTLLTLQGTYDGKSLFYPIAINATDGTEDDTDGTGIKRNNKYVINVEFSQFGNGTTNPDDPTPLTALTAEVQVVPWQGPINQNTTW